MEGEKCKSCGTAVDEGRRKKSFYASSCDSCISDFCPAHVCDHLLHDYCAGLLPPFLRQNLGLVKLPQLRGFYAKLSTEQREKEAHRNSIQANKDVLKTDKGISENLPVEAEWAIDSDDGSLGSNQLKKGDIIGYSNLFRATICDRVRIDGIASTGRTRFNVYLVDGIMPLEVGKMCYDTNWWKWSDDGMRRGDERSCQMITWVADATTQDMYDRKRAADKEAMEREREEEAKLERQKQAKKVQNQAKYQQRKSREAEREEEKKERRQSGLQRVIRITRIVGKTSRH